jgi:hypothetical protein
MARCVRFKNPFETVGASFRFFASNGTMSPRSMNHPCMKQGKSIKACNQKEEFGLPILKC